MAESIGMEDMQSARRAIASSFWILSALSLFLTLVIALIYPHVNAPRLFNVHSGIAVHESGPALLAFSLCYIFNVPLGVVFSVQFGLQSGYAYNIWSSLGTIASLGALVIAMRFQAGLPVLILALFAPPLVASILNGIRLFGFVHPELRPDPRDFSMNCAFHLLHIGAMFFLIQLSFAVGMQTDNIVIAQIMGAKSVSDYAVPARMFNMVTAFLILLSGSMWPAYADALARSDAAWIRKGFLRVAGFGGILTVLATAVFVLFGNRILAVWVGPSVHASRPLLLVFGLQCILYAYLQPIGSLLNGLGKLRVQAICGVAMAALNLALSIVFVRHYGIIGAVLGTTIALLAVEVVPLTLAVRQTLRELSQVVPQANIISAQLQVERTNVLP